MKKIFRPIIFLILYVLTTLFILSLISMSFGCRHHPPRAPESNKCQKKCIKEYHMCQDNLGIRNCRKPFRGCMDKC